MSSAERITADSLVRDVVGHYPQTIVVFGRRGMQCPGCYISPFHTVADTAREYAMSLAPLLSDLNRALGLPENGAPASSDDEG